MISLRDKIISPSDRTYYTHLSLRYFKNNIPFHIFYSVLEDLETKKRKFNNGKI
jgi:hypothetical protein